MWFAFTCGTKCLIQLEPKSPQRGEHLAFNPGRKTFCNAKAKATAKGKAKVKAQAKAKAKAKAKANAKAKAKPKAKVKAQAKAKAREARSGEKILRSNILQC